MSTELSKNTFTDSAQNGAFSWLFEGFRTRMRNAAFEVQFSAGWNNRPTIHKWAESIHNRLTKPEDIENTRQEWVHAHAQRCADVYATLDRLGDMSDPERRTEVALDIGLGMDFDDPAAEITLDEVLALYRAEYLKGKPPAAIISHDIA